MICNVKTFCEHVTSFEFLFFIYKVLTYPCVYLLNIEVFSIPMYFLSLYLGFCCFYAYKISVIFYCEYLLFFEHHANTKIVHLYPDNFFGGGMSVNQLSLALW